MVQPRKKHSNAKKTFEPLRFMTFGDMACVSSIILVFCQDWFEVGLVVFHLVLYYQVQSSEFMGET